MEMNEDTGRLVREPMVLSTDDDNGIYEATPIIIDSSKFVEKEKELELFEVDICYSLISEEDFYQRFFKIIENWEEDEIEPYILGVKALAIKFQKKGFQFSSDQLERIEKLTGLVIENRYGLTDEERENADKFKKVFEIYTSDELFNKYAKTKNLDELINGISKRDLNKDATKILHSFVAPIYLSEQFEYRYWRFRVCQDCYYKVYLDDNVSIDPELEKRIMRNIPKNLSDELMAYNIYIELNKQVSLDSRFYITHQNGEEKYNQNLKNQEINEINPDNLICKSWSAIYYYLIKKYTGIECYISVKAKNGEGHRYVMLLMDNGETIAVDGTNVVHDNMLDTNFTDILRCKLGLPTVNFTSYMDYNSRRDTNDEKADPKEIMQKILNIVGTKEEINDLNELIRNNRLDTKSKLKLFMEFIEKRKDLDSISMRALFSNLIYLFFKGQERVRLLEYYKEIENDQYEYVNCIKYTDDNNEDIYLLFDKELGFIDSSLEEINNLIGKGDIKHIPRRGI